MMAADRVSFCPFVSLVVSAPKISTSARLSALSLFTLIYFTLIYFTLNLFYYYLFSLNFLHLAFFTLNSFIPGIPIFYS